MLQNSTWILTVFAEGKKPLTSTALKMLLNFSLWKGNTWSNCSCRVAIFLLPWWTVFSNQTWSKISRTIEHWTLTIKEQWWVNTTVIKMTILTQAVCWQSIRKWVFIVFAILENDSREKAEGHMAVYHRKIVMTSVIRSHASQNRKLTLWSSHIGKKTCLI